MQRIRANIWFNDQAEEAAQYYTSILPDGRVDTVSYYGEAGREYHKQKPGSVMTVDFSLGGHGFTALNGGPMFRPNPSISFFVNCTDAAEVDRYWERLSAVPEAEACGWLKDRFGVSWQVTPSEFYELVGDGSSEVAQRVMSAMMPMKKLHIDALRRAAGAR